MLTREEKVVMQGDFQAFERLEYFKDWEQDRKQRNLTKILSQGMPDCEPPPEVVLSISEQKEMVAEIIQALKDRFGELMVSFLYKYYVEGEKVEDLAATYGVSTRTIYRMINLYSAEAKDYIVRNFNNCFEAIWFISPAKGSSDGGVPMFQHEYEKHRAYGTYNYNGKKVKTKCQMPEYLKTCFGDDETKCPLCFNDWGTDTCRRKKVN